MERNLLERKFDLFKPKRAVWKTEKKILKKCETMIYFACSKEAFGFEESVSIFLFFPEYR